MTLDEFLKGSGQRPEMFAEAIGTSGIAVKKYLAGERRPRRDILQRIYDATAGAVTANDFFLQEMTPQRTRKKKPK